MNFSASYVSTQITRRQLFQTCGIGLGKAALASLLLRDQTAAAAAVTARVSAEHHRPRARRVIFLFMAGAPSQLDLFDYKPKLKALGGQPIPPSVIDGQRYAFIQPDAAILPPQFKFQRHGQSGIELSDQLPHLAKVVDDISLLKAVHTDQFNHAPAQLLVNTGSPIPGRPAMGSWLSYGIGSEADDLPAFVVLKSGGNLSGGAAMWGPGFLPGQHQGVPFRSGGDPILHLSSPDDVDRPTQRQTLDLINHLNETRIRRMGVDAIRTRIEAYEMAYRMQSAAPELTDMSGESAETLEMYGIDQPGDGSFANQCLLARRMAERGVR